MGTEDTQAAVADLGWIAPGAAADPRAALHRIETICSLHPTLFGCMNTVLATHPGVPRAVLAQAIKQFRRDADAHPLDDVVSLLNAIANGAQQAFDAVLRTRRGADRKAAALPFVRPD